MSVYRITTRFRTEDEDERRAAEYLKSLKYGEQNRFVVDAVLARMEGGHESNLRQIVREELAAAFAAAPQPVSSSFFSRSEAPEQQPEDDLSILDDLKLFD